MMMVCNKKVIYKENKREYDKARIIKVRAI